MIWAFSGSKGLSGNLEPASGGAERAPKALSAASANRRAPVCAAVVPHCPSEIKSPRPKRLHSGSSRAP